MKEFEKMANHELAVYIVGYIERIQKLMEDVIVVISGKNCNTANIKE